MHPIVDSACCVVLPGAQVSSYNLGPFRHLPFEWLSRAAHGPLESANAFQSDRALFHSALGSSLRNHLPDAPCLRELPAFGAIGDLRACWPRNRRPGDLQCSCDASGGIDVG